MSVRLVYSTGRSGQATITTDAAGLVGGIVLIVSPAQPTYTLPVSDAGTAP